MDLVLCYQKAKHFTTTVSKLIKKPIKNKPWKNLLNTQLKQTSQASY